MSDETFNMSLRKFLKRVGVTSQQHIETAVRDAQASGAISGGAVNARRRDPARSSSTGVKLVSDAGPILI